MIFLRFGIVYFLTAVIDNGLFWLTLRATGGSILIAQFAGRAGSIPFNYLAVRSKVFASKARHEETAPKFIALYLVGFVLSYLMIRGFSELFFGIWPRVKHDYLVIVAKLISEGLILIGKFFVQRFWIFKPAEN